MTLRERLIEQISQLSTAEVIALTQVVDVMKRTPVAHRVIAREGLAKTRKALADLPSDLSQDIVAARDERL